VFFSKINEVFKVTELAEGGSLHDKIHSDDPLEYVTTTKIF
jgi:hypothetical protein